MTTPDKPAPSESAAEVRDRMAGEFGDKDPRNEPIDWKKGWDACAEFVRKGGNV